MWPNVAICLLFLYSWPIAAISSTQASSVPESLYLAIDKKRKQTNVRKQVSNVMARTGVKCYILLEQIVKSYLLEYFHLVYLKYVVSLDALFISKKLLSSVMKSKQAKLDAVTHAKMGEIVARFQC